MRSGTVSFFLIFLQAKQNRRRKVSKRRKGEGGSKKVVLKGVFPCEGLMGEN